MTFCKFDEHSSPLFKQTNILKLFDLIKFQISIFMYKFHKNRLPAVFDSYFLSISKVHNYSTRLSSTHAYALPKARTNYGKFRIKFIGAKVWNAYKWAVSLILGNFSAALYTSFLKNYPTVAFKPTKQNVGSRNNLKTQKFHLTFGLTPNIFLIA